MKPATILLCLATTFLKVETATIANRKSFLSTLEDTVKSTMEKQLVTHLAQSTKWQNTPEFYEQIVQLIKETEGKLLGDIVRTILEKSNGTGALSMTTIENVVSSFLKTGASDRKRDDDRMPNYLNTRFGGFGR
ncbi:uncharacterized protein LOC125646403 [Ostrea edulis]|uniref:uncharacterized protein LOC125646403 n=1 Tax=Ostrea edulis TaxID=37623 RepID=UPI002094AD43|nr:uncharacterized protein LOC125646403 [Ostrea edulis]